MSKNPSSPTVSVDIENVLAETDRAPITEIRFYASPALNIPANIEQSFTISELRLTNK